MSTSELGCLSRLPSTIASAQKPVSTGQYRFLINNVLHAADESWNTLVAWNAKTGSVQYVEASATDTDRWRLMITFPCTLSVRSDGTCYPIVVRVGGSADGKLGAQVKFRIAVSSPETVSNAFSRDAVGMAVETIAVNSTPAWLTTSPARLTMPSIYTAACMRSESTLDAVGGAYNSAPVASAVISVWGTTTGATSDIRLYSVYAREFVGT